MSAPESPGPGLRHAFPLSATELGPALPPAHNAAPLSAHPREEGMMVPVVDGATGEVVTRRIQTNVTQEGGEERMGLDGKRVNSVRITRSGAAAAANGSNGTNGFRHNDGPTRAITAPMRRGELTQGFRPVVAAQDTTLTSSERAMARAKRGAPAATAGRASVQGAIGPLSWATRTPDDGPGFADRAMARIGEDPELEGKRWLRDAGRAASALLRGGRDALRRLLHEDSGDLPLLQATATAVTTGTLAVPAERPATTGNTYGTATGEPGAIPPTPAGPAPAKVVASVSAPAITARPDTEPVAGPITVAWTEGSYAAAEAATASTAPAQPAVTSSQGETSDWFSPTPTPATAPAKAAPAAASEELGSEATQAVAWFGDTAASVDELTAPAAVTYTAPATTDPQVGLLYTHYEQAAASGDPGHRAQAWQYYRHGMEQGYTNIDKPPFADPAGIYFDATKVRASAQVPINTARPAVSADANTTNGVVAVATEEHGERTGVIRWNTKAGLPDRSVRPANVAAPEATSEVVDAEIIYTPGTPEFDARMGELNRQRIMLEDEVRNGISDPARAAEVDRQTEGVLRETAAMMRASSQAQERAAGAQTEDDRMDLLERVLSGLRRL